MTNIDRLTQLVLQNPQLIAKQMAIGQFCTMEMNCTDRECDQCWIEKLEGEIR